VSTNTTRTHSGQQTHGKPSIEVEVRSFTYCQRSSLVGFADIILNQKMGIRHVAYFVPLDASKRPYCKFPNKKETGPHGEQWVSLVWWVDQPTNFRILGHIAKEIDKYLLTHRATVEAEDRPTRPPRAEIPTDFNIPI
jgi:hypothetical protein